MKWHRNEPICPAAPVTATLIGADSRLSGGAGKCLPSYCTLDTKIDLSISDPGGAKFKKEIVVGLN